MRMRRVDRQQQCLEPGDYTIVDICANCDAQGRCAAEGGGVEYHYSSCASNAPKRAFLIVCICGTLMRSNKAHQVLSEDPLTIMPSWSDPYRGCHSWIRDGVWTNC